MSCWHRSDLSDHRITIKVMGDGGKTLLNVIRPCGMGVSLSEALGISRSLHLTVGYLMNELEDLDSKSKIGLIT